MYTFSLIRKGAVHTGKKKIIPKEDFADLLSAKEVLEEAKLEAIAAHEALQKECAKKKEEASEEGFQEGLEKFYEHMLLFDERIRVIRHEMQKQILPLVLKATKRIIGEELELRPESVVHIVLQAIKSVVQCKVVKIYVHKGDLQHIEPGREKIKAAFEQLESFQLEERPDIPKGSCIIETEKGILNATLDNQYRALERAFEVFAKKR